MIMTGCSMHESEHDPKAIMYPASISMITIAEPQISPKYPYKPSLNRELGISELPYLMWFPLKGWGWWWGVVVVVVFCCSGQKTLGHEAIWPHHKLIRTWKDKQRMLLFHDLMIKSQDDCSHHYRVTKTFVLHIMSSFYVYGCIIVLLQQEFNYVCSNGC